MGEQSRNTSSRVLGGKVITEEQLSTNAVVPDSADMHAGRSHPASPADGTYCRRELSLRA